MEPGKGPFVDYCLQLRFSEVQLFSMKLCRIATARACFSSAPVAQIR